MAVSEKHRKQMAGIRFGLWTIVSRCQQRNKVIARCDCGYEREIFLPSLCQGRPRGCPDCVPRKYSGPIGVTRCDEYRIYQGAIQRCHNKSSPAYANYGGRGIYVSEEWRADFTKFLADMGRRPDGATLERIDNDGPYSAQNCRWASRKDQCNNTRRNVHLVWNGRSQTVAQWADELGISRVMVFKRLKRGWNADAALTTPPKKSKTSFRDAA